MIVASVDWTNVLVALIAGLPAIIAAIAAMLVRRDIKTPSGTAIGKQVENALHTSLANNYHLRALGNTVGAPPSPEARTEAAKVPDLPEGTGK